MRKGDNGMANHVHYWVIDGSNFGRCKIAGCNATRQFPVEELTTFTKNERGWIENLKIPYGANVYHVNIPGFYIPDMG